MAFTASDIKNLREMTGAGMMECKKALTECDGNIDEAAKYLKEKVLLLLQNVQTALLQKDAFLSAIPETRFTL